jgi:CheY-like chemotaxis protein
VASGAILLVDDDETIRHVIRTMLELHGYRVIDAALPQRALTLFEQDPAAIDLLITDVRMPGMTGPALADRLAHTRTDLPVLFMSGGMNAAHSAALRGAQRRVLVKPFKASMLLDAIRELLSFVRP